jgi:uncharacterized protein
MSGLPIAAQTTLLLIGSNVFMTFAWYAHLKNLNDKPWWIAAFVSWGVALFEYLWAGLCLIGAVYFIFRGPS